MRYNAKKFEQGSLVPVKIHGYDNMEAFYCLKHDEYWGRSVSHIVWATIGEVNPTHLNPDGHVDEKCVTKEQETFDRVRTEMAKHTSCVFSMVPCIWKPNRPLTCPCYESGIRYENNTSDTEDDIDTESTVCRNCRKVFVESLNLTGLDLAGYRGHEEYIGLCVCVCGDPRSHSIVRHYTDNYCNGPYKAVKIDGKTIFVTSKH
jgi:hypothetical protein